MRYYGREAEGGRGRCEGSKKQLTGEMRSEGKMLKEGIWVRVRQVRMSKWEERGKMRV